MRHDGNTDIMASEKTIRRAKAAVLLAAAAVLIIAISFKGLKRADYLRSTANRREVPDFRLSDLSGGSWRLSDHRGEVVVVNFWATWCGPCRDETPGLVRFWHQYAGKGVAVVGVNIMDDNPKTDVPPFVSEFRIPYPIVLADSSVSLADHIEGLPTTFLLDRRGRIAQKWVGELDDNELRDAIDKLLREPA